MAANSKIEWTTHTFNPWRGCTKVAAGCANCYADTLSKRNPGTLGTWGPNGTRVLASEAMWREPVKWNKAAECLKTFDCANGDHADCCPQSRANRPRVFCASLADVFEDWQGPIMAAGKQPVILGPNFRASSGERLTMDSCRERLFRLIDATPELDWLLLTKRPENIRSMWNAADDRPAGNLQKHRKNVWLGTSIATQEDADRNIPLLLECRDLAPVLFLSIEPMLGPVDLSSFLGDSHATEERGGFCLQGSVDGGIGSRQRGQDLASGGAAVESLDRRNSVNSMHSQKSGKEHGEVPSDSCNGEQKAGSCIVAPIGMGAFSQSPNTTRNDDQPQRRESDKQPSGQLRVSNPCRTNGTSNINIGARSPQKPQAISWVIVGGESGPNARPCNVDWIRDIRDQCAAAGVPCFIKQLGAFPTDRGAEGIESSLTDEDAAFFRINSIKDKKGGDWDEWPEDLRVRQFPEATHAN